MRSGARGSSNKSGRSFENITSLVERKRKAEENSSEGEEAREAGTMMIRSEVEIENGQWCVILENETQNHNEMTECWIWK